MKRRISTREIKRAERLKLLKDLVSSGAYTSSSSDVAKALVRNIDEVDAPMRSIQ
jgi:anti-sigma28 factor (negative regulator of flagellin synthesis)